MHISVLLHESIDLLAIRQGDIVVDGTLGGGGHSEAICKQFGRTITLIGIDTDEDALVRGEARLKAAGCTPYLVHANVRDIDTVLQKLAIQKIDKVLLDLGISSFHVDDSGRGFSFLRDEPLLMTMRKHVGKDDVTAYDVVNSWEESSLYDILKGYGEERFAKRIAHAIIAARSQAPIKTTFQLKDIVTQAVPSIARRSKIHPATKTFQAIRIAVNDELESLKEALSKSFEALSSDGRISVISFHSLEDRIVKRFFQEKIKDGLARQITKKPLTPSDEEIYDNPRSRSAKLRVLQKI